MGRELGGGEPLQGRGAGFHSKLLLSACASWHLAQSTRKQLARQAGKWSSWRSWGAWQGDAQMPGQQAGDAYISSS